MKFCHVKLQTRRDIIDTKQITNNIKGLQVNRLCLPGKPGNI